MINFIAMLLCLWAMKSNIDSGYIGWASIAGAFALFNALAVIF